MTRKVNSAIEALGGLTEARYWKAITALQEEVQKNADYDKPILMMARAIKDEFGDQLPLMVSRNLYRRRLALGEQGKFVGVLSARSRLVGSIIALARAERDVKGVQAIVNYNYDDTLDENLRREKVRCITVRSGRDRVPLGALPCFHVHGVLPREEMRKRRPYRETDAIGNFVFSEDEYHAEYSDPYRWSNMTQMSLLGRYTGLFIGLSMEDPNIRRLIDVTHRQYPEILNYAVLPRKRSLARSKDSKRNILTNLYEEVESTSFARIGVKVIWVDAHSEIPEVLERICGPGIEQAKP